MITNALIIIGTIVGIVAMVVFVHSLANAPDGVEGEAGFEFVKDAKPGRNRYHSAKAAVARPTKVAKPFKAQLPTASALPWDF